MLFYLDSNQDKQDQNLLCYHYTIEQSACKFTTFYPNRQILRPFFCIFALFPTANRGTVR